MNFFKQKLKFSDIDGDYPNHSSDSPPQVTIAMREFELEMSYAELPKEPAHSGLQHQTTAQTHSGKFLYIEIECCKNLKEPDFALTNSALPDPFIIVKLGGVEIARTKTIYNKVNPVWYEECFEVPAILYKTQAGDNKQIMIEVWDMNILAVGDLLGVATFEIDKGGLNRQTIESVTHELDTAKRPMAERPNFKRTGTAFQIIDETLIKEGRMGADHKTMLDNTPASKQWARLRGKMKNSQSKSNFKVPNPNPTRRIGSDNKLQFDDFKSSKKTLYNAVGLILGYLGLGVVTFSYIFETEWTIRESLYFSVVTFTTVGYGDLYPTTDGGRLWCCLFSLIGISIIGYALSIISQRLVQISMNKITESAQGTRHEESEDIFNEKDSEAEITRKIAEHARKILKKEEKASMEESTRTRKKILKIFQPIALTLAFGTVVVKNIEMTSTGEVDGDGEDILRSWTWVEAFYWCVITGASVGYGEYCPKNEFTQWFSVFFIPMSVGVIGAALGKIANIYVEKEIKKANKRLLGRELTMEDLDNMNTDDDGEVSELEFIEFMLKTMKKVDQTLLDDLHKSFKKMDADGSGSLQKEDLELLAKKKLDLSRKLQMAAYKQSLEHKAEKANNHEGRSKVAVAS